MERSTRSESISVISAGSRFSSRSSLSKAQKSVVGLSNKEWDETSFYSGSFIDAPFLSYFWNELCHLLLAHYQKLEDGEALKVPYFGIFLKPFNKNCEFPIFQFNKNWISSFPQYGNSLVLIPKSEVSLDIQELHRRMLPTMKRFDLSELTTNQLRLVLKDVLRQFFMTLKRFKTRYVRIVFQKFCRMIFEKDRMKIHYFPEVKSEKMALVKMSENQKKVILIRERGEVQTPVQMLNEERILKKRRSMQLPKSFSASIQKQLCDGDPLKKKLKSLHRNSEYLEECKKLANEYEKFQKEKYRDGLLQQIQEFREHREMAKYRALKREREMVSKWKLGKIRNLNLVEREDRIRKKKNRSNLVYQIEEKKRRIQRHHKEKKRKELTDLKTVQIGFKKEYEVWKKLKEDRKRRNFEYNLYLNGKKLKKRNSSSAQNSKRLHKKWRKISKRGENLVIKDWKLKYNKVNRGNLSRK